MSTTSTETRLVDACFQTNHPKLGDLATRINSINSDWIVLLDGDPTNTEHRKRWLINMAQDAEQLAALCRAMAGGL